MDPKRLFDFLFLYRVDVRIDCLVYDLGSTNPRLGGSLLDVLHRLNVQVQRVLGLAFVLLCQIFRCFNLHKIHYTVLTPVKKYDTLWYKLYQRLADKYYVAVERMLGVCE